MVKKMEEKVFRYFRHHTIAVLLIVVTGFLLLAAGEYYLYRKIMVVNQMVAEGVMQIKEATQPIKIPPPLAK